MKETNIGKEILIAASKAGHRLFLNARGRGWVGGKAVVAGGVVTLRGASQVKFGVGPDGASDLIGWTRNGLFAAIEVKTETGSIREGQPEFIEAVRRSGGVAGIARSVADAMAILDGSA